VSPQRMLWKVSAKVILIFISGFYLNVTQTFASSYRWGYCGLTDDFCTVNKTGAPGTGCQSNCQLLSDFDDVGKSSGECVIFFCPESIRRFSEMYRILVSHPANPGRNIIGYYSNCKYIRTLSLRF